MSSSSSSYTGALATKRKTDLQDIANALDISSDGVKEALVARIKEHLDKHQGALEDDARFAGLYAGKRRKPSVPPSDYEEPKEIKPRSRTGASRRSTTATNTTIVASLAMIPEPGESPPTFIGRSRKALMPIPATPAADLRDVSVMLKNMHSPQDSPTAYTDSPGPSVSSLPSPTSAVVRAKDSVPMRAAVTAKEVVKYTEEQLLQNGSELVDNTRAFFSDSRNIWSTTAVVELACILYTIIPWEHYSVTEQHQFPYPPLLVFQSPAFWITLMHWMLPTLVLPIFAGRIISFSPAVLLSSPSPTGRKSSSSSPGSSSYKAIDPLTASIIRLFVHVIYPYPALGAQTPGVDVLGREWRVWSAALGVTFAFAEAVGLGAAGRIRSPSPPTSEYTRDIPLEAYARKAIRSAEDCNALEEE